MSDNLDYKYLLDIDNPADLRKLKPSSLPVVCDELRDYIIDTITQIGGHFGAGLGMVELTVALHYVFNTPKDKIVIDTGHQGYPHKVLTGRRDQLSTIRQKDGLSGFLKRTESEYDEFGAGHASTSVSAALGMAAARDINKDNYKVISVIGDGAMTGGLAFEALNNAGVLQKDLLVILNDNEFSIAPNVSALSNYFSEVFTSKPFKRIRDKAWSVTGKMDELGDRLRKIASKLEDGVKAVITPGVLFEALGFNYIGPVNGHNVSKLVNILENIKDMKGPIFLHVMTQKGYGYEHATRDTQFMHAIGKIDKITGKSVASNKPVVKTPPKYQDVFGQAVLEICKKQDDVVSITAAMPGGTGLNIVQKEMPEKVIDVGIAEGHAVTFAAGLATQGVIPIVAIYSTFLQRAYDHIIHDCAIQKLHVVFALDRAGVVGADGPTHHGVMDLAYLRPIQGIVVMAPKDEQELRDMLYSAVNHYKSGPVAIRFPRGASIGVPLEEMKGIELGKSETLREGTDVAILGIGNMVQHSLDAADILSEQGVNATVVNARFVKPLDTDMIDELCKRNISIITVEDGQKQGGFGSAVAEYMAEKNYTNRLTIIGIEDEFIEHGTQDELYEVIGIDAKGIAKSVLKSLEERVKI
jgi:1-deoxy-D-xylulose-5-phosphate synthase